MKYTAKKHAEKVGVRDVETTTLLLVIMITIDRTATGVFPSKLPV